MANGTLSHRAPRLSFQLDENGLPTDCGQYKRNDANELVEEFMLLTNIAVAQHVAVHLPEQALLRRHDTPIDRRLVSADPSTSLLPKIDQLYFIEHIQRTRCSTRVRDGRFIRRRTHEIV